MMSDDIKVSKGLELLVVGLPGVGHMPAASEDEKDAARVFYVAAMRATQKLVVGVGWKRVIQQEHRLLCVVGRGLKQVVERTSNNSSLVSRK